MSDNAAASMMQAGLALNAMSANMRADEAEEALENIVDTELQSIGRVLGKQTEFWQAAEEITGQISQRVTQGLTDDLEKIRVREGLFSIFPTSVPRDVFQQACRDGNSLLAGFLKETLDPEKTPLAAIAVEGVRDADEEEIHFESGRGVEFVADLDQKELAAVAKLGVLQTIQQAVLEESRGYYSDRPDGVSRQQYRATKKAFRHAADRLDEICEDLKGSYEETVVANAPAPEAP